MPTLQVLPRPTPEERHDRHVEIEVDEALSAHAALVEDWCTPRQNWEVTLHEGHNFGRTNNMEGRLMFVSGAQTSTLLFRLDQLERADDVGGELVLIFEEENGIAKLARASANGLEVELHHILTYT